MKRLVEENLKSWYKQENRKPLVIQGARQVGKSTLVKNFCKNESINLFEINLEKRKLKSLNVVDEIDIISIINEIEDVCGKELIATNSIVFLDEIQDSKLGFQALRYFYEERPDLAVIAAGSLLNLYLHSNEITVPVGRIEYLHLGPMTFTEFLMAMDEHLLLKRLNSYWQITDTQFQKLHDLMNCYILVGGMPEAVLNYSKNKSFLKVRKIQNDLIESFRNDFHKYSKKNNIDSINEVFNFTVQNLGKKVKYSEINQTTKSALLKNAINSLIHANIIHKVSHTHASGVPLSVGSNSEIFKLYFIDIGLVSASSDLNQEILNKKDWLNKGDLAEQFIHQHLIYNFQVGHKSNLYYWLNDKPKSQAEIDLLIQSQREIIPIEIKFSSSKKVKSLWHFIEIKNIERAVHFGIHKYEIKKESHKSFTNKGSNIKVKLYQLPLFFIEYLNAILKEK